MKRATKATGAISKTGGVLFALLFAVGFGAGGVFGVASLWGNLHGTWQARSWVPVRATVLGAQLLEQYDETTTYRVTARYKYEYRGREYEGTRVGFSDGYDNVGSWQQDRYNELRAAQGAGRSIEIWVDPEQPDHAIVDRHVRWGMVVFAIPFAILFPAVSIGAVWFLIRILRAPPGELLASPPLAGNTSQIKSNARATALTLWGFAGFWSLIAFPLAFLFLGRGGAEWWVTCLVMFFPLVGVALLWAAVNRTVQLVRHGVVTLALDPPHPRLGETLRVTASFDRDPVQGEYTIALVCQNVDTRGDSTSERTVWRQERTVQALGAHALAAFSPPAHLPSSQARADVYHQWRVLLTFPGGKDERAFDIVIEAARDSVSNTHDEETPFAVPLEGVAAQPIPAAVASVIDERSRLEICFAANGRGTAIACVLFACVFGGIGGVILFGDHDWLTPRIMGLMFAAVGVGLLGGGVYALTHRRRVAIAHGQVQVDSDWLFGAKQETFRVDETVKLVPRITSTASTGAQTWDNHQIRAHLRDGRKIVLASGVRDPGVVRTLVDLIARHLEIDAERAIEPLRSRSISDAEEVAVFAKRFKLGIRLVGALLLLAFLWDFASPFLPWNGPHEKSNPAELDVER